MKRNIFCVLMFILSGILFAENAVDYTRNWESRNTLIYEDGNVLCHQKMKIDISKSIKDTYIG